MVCDSVLARLRDLDVSGFEVLSVEGENEVVARWAMAVVACSKPANSSIPSTSVVTVRAFDASVVVVFVLLKGIHVNRG